MENYKILKILNTTCYGQSCLVENVNDKNQYVLKTIECHDESAANKAFFESLKVFHNSNHTFVVACKEVFVHWVKENSSVCLCFVSPYYSNGNLENIVKRNVASNTTIEVNIIKKWIGQLIEALYAFHNNKLIHRGIKLSNVLLKEDLSLVLGDYSVGTIMADQQTNFSINEYVQHELCLCPPEVIKGNPKSYTTYSDMWLFGIFILKLMSCSNFAQKNINVLIKDCFQSKHLVEDAKNILKKCYPNDMVDICFLLLQSDPTLRPTIDKLIQMPLIKECLSIAGSNMAERKKKQQMKTTEHPLPSDLSDYSMLLEYVQKEKYNENCVSAAFEHICICSKQEQFVLSQEQLQILQSAVIMHIVNEDICTSFCNILNNLAVNMQVGEFIVNKSIISTVVLTMKQHENDCTLQLSAAALLMAFSSNKTLCKHIGEMDGIATLIAATTNIPNNAELFAMVSNALWTLCSYSANVKTCIDRNAMSIITGGMKQFLMVPEVQEHSAAVLLALSMDQNAITDASKYHAMELLLTALKNHPRCTKLVRNVCLALASYIEANEEYGLLALDAEYSEQPLPGLPLYEEVYEIHRDNVEVAEAIAGVFFELSKHAELVKCVCDIAQLIDLVNVIRKRFLKISTIVQPIDQSLRNLELVTLQ